LLFKTERQGRGVIKRLLAIEELNTERPTLAFFLASTKFIGPVGLGPPSYWNLHRHFGGEDYRGFINVCSVLPIFFKHEN
jgi:hypothetical protein